MQSGSIPDAPAVAATPATRRYSLYVLLVLTLVSCLSSLDRQIVAILAESIKADLGLSDTQVGLLYGTVFAVFHALFGLLLARLADLWSRQKLIAIALVCWSGLTACSGAAGNFWQLLLARMGVSVGESVASPASFSLLAQWFSTRRRATALALYSGGAFLGAGIGMALGGAVAQAWDVFFGAQAPWQLRGWQVAFFVAGAPGLLLALWTWRLRNPPAQPAVATRVSLWRELTQAVPPFNGIALLCAGGRAALLNAALLCVCAGAALWLARVVGDPLQWSLLALGCYGAITWLQHLHRREPAAAGALLGRGVIVWLALGCGFISAITASISLWMAPYLIRSFGIDAATAGWRLGGAFAISGWLGVTLGGLWSDRWRVASTRGRVYVALLSALLPVPLLGLSLGSRSFDACVAWLFAANLCATLWVAAGSTSVQEAVPAAMRATASAFYLLVVTYVGMSLGPYVVGRLSDQLGSLAAALLWQTGAAALLAAACLLAAARRVDAGPPQAAR